MAFTSIRVREEDKKAFDRLRHEYALLTGSEPSDHELFHRILVHALASKPSIMPPVPAGRRSWGRYQFDLGDETDAANGLDIQLYGPGQKSQRTE